jgi:hypothetical protein
MFEYRQRELAVIHEQLSIMQHLVDKMRVSLDCLDQDITSGDDMDFPDDEWTAGYHAGKIMADALKPVDNDMPKLCTCDACWDVNDPHDYRMD